ncbi:MAG: CDP-glucose 4,6-dehydratase [Proteobacteria bacterium]|nr:CDP-glucose 4,6-dehydratase [Pseudomonadota bacterium]
MTGFFGDAYRGKRVLVTGHTGFKGSWLTTWLLDLGAEVCGFSDGVPTQPSLFEAAGLGRRVRDERGDVRDPVRVSEVVADFRPDFVFHLAAQAIVSTSYADPLNTLSVNVMGTAVVLEALRKLQQPCTAIIVTSDKAYENVEWSWGYRETDRLAGRDVYSGSKSGAELVVYSYLHSFFRQDGPVRVSTVRAGNVLGGGDWAADRIVADCIRAWSTGGRVQIRSPSSTRPWQHVLEPLSGYLALAARMAEDASLHGEPFNFGPRAEETVNVLKLLGDLAQVWGFEAPSESYEVTGNVPFHEAGLLRLNIDKALLMLRWAPTLFYEECVDFTGSWYRDVVRDGRAASEATTEQVRAFESLARERRRKWAS